MFDDDVVDVCNCIHSALSLLWSEGGYCTHSGRRKGGMCPESMGRSNSHLYRSVPFYILGVTGCISIHSMGW